MQKCINHRDGGYLQNNFDFSEDTKLDNAAIGTVETELLRKDLGRMFNWSRNGKTFLIWKRFR